MSTIDRHSGFGRLVAVTMALALIFAAVLGSYAHASHGPGTHCLTTTEAIHSSADHDATVTVHDAVVTHVVGVAAQGLDAETGLPGAGHNLCNHTGCCGGLSILPCGKMVITPNRVIETLRPLDATGAGRTLSSLDRPPKLLPHA